MSAPAAADDLEEVEEVQQYEHRTGRKESGVVKQEGRVWRIPLIKKKLLLLKFKKLGALTTLPLLPLLLRNSNGEAQIVQVLPVGGGSGSSPTYAIPSDLLQEQVVEVAEESAPEEEDESFAENAEVIEIESDSDKPLSSNIAAKKISGLASLQGLSGLSGIAGLSGLGGQQGIIQGLGGQTPIILYAVPSQVEYGRAAGHSVKPRRRLVRI